MCYDKFITGDKWFAKVLKGLRQVRFAFGGGGKTPLLLAFLLFLL
jgi:hypothetical protein